MLPLLFFSFFPSKRKQGVNCWVSADKQISLLTKTQQSHWYFGCTWDGNEGFLVLFDVVITTERSTEDRRSVGATWSDTSNNGAITLWGSCTGRSSQRPVALPSWFFFVPSPRPFWSKTKPLERVLFGILFIYFPSSWRDRVCIMSTTHWHRIRQPTTRGFSGRVIEFDPFFLFFFYTSQLFSLLTCLAATGSYKK